MAKILLGVSAGIAAYKVLELASTLTQRGDQVITLMTPRAREFVTPLSFRALTREKVYTEIFEDTPEASTEHVALSQWGELMVLAPATADLIGRIAAGLGDDIITTTLLAFDRPVLLAPAMNDRMWANPLVRRNLRQLQDLGYQVIEPESGHLACGSVGPGRLAKSETIIAAIDLVLKSRKQKS